MSDNDNETMVDEMSVPSTDGHNVNNENIVEDSPNTSLLVTNVMVPKPRSVRKRRNPWSQAKKRRKVSSRKKTKPKVFGEYWEIEHVLAVRERVVEPLKATTKKGKRTDGKSADKSYNAPTTITEFLIQWKGSFENSWEPEENLCDTALDEAHFLLEKEATRKLGLVDQKKTSQEHSVLRSSPRLKLARSEIGDESSDDDFISENEVDVPDPDGIDGENQKGSYQDQCHEEDDTLIVDTALVHKNLIVEDTNFDWSNSSLNKLPIQRISVNDPDCKTQLMMSRLLGVPIVLTHHKGWVQFASRWLVLPSSHSISCTPECNSGQDTATAVCPKTGDDVISNDLTCESMNCSTGALSEYIDVIGGIKEVSSLNERESVDFVSDTDFVTSQSGVVTDEASTLEPSALNRQDNNDLGHEVFDGDNEENQDPSCQMLLGSNSVNDSVCDQEKVINDVEPLDLTLPYVIDIDKMVNDIGSEMVPILRKNYNDEQPIKAFMSIRRFLRDYWPNASSPHVDKGRDEDAASSKKVPLLYLHQWLFTASETAVPKLCNQNYFLPQDILNEDLLRYWYNKDQCAGDSPYQYLFMGSTETMSRLHKDSGGLDIFIAPIIGQKEVTLVHRSDGPTSLYHLEANIDVPNFQKFPMLYSARVWQSIILPGEILVMPFGTFHQCRNVTPCLSYHRFHLDSLNLHAFYESWRDRDAPDIDHEEVIWNAATELSSQIDMYTETFRNGQNFAFDVQTKLANADAPAPVIAAVSSLQCLHKVCLEISMREDLINDHSSDWKLLVQDVEETLHEFRYRKSDVIPKLHRKHPRKTSVRKNNKH